MENTENVPFAAPPKFGPNIMGQEAYDRALQAHLLWLNSTRQSDVGPGGGGETNAPPKPEESQQEDGKQEKSKRQDSGKPGTFNVYADTDGQKGKRVGTRVISQSPDHAIAEVAAAMEQNERDRHTNFEARRQRGSGFKGGTDTRRKQEQSEGEPGQGEQESQSPPPPPQADDIMIHRLQSAPLIGQEAEAKIKQIAGDSGISAEDLQTMKDEMASLIVAAMNDMQTKVEENSTKTVKIQYPDGRIATVEGETHPMFAETLRILAAREPVYLYGPSGTGKTHMAEQLAEALFPDMDKADRFYGLSATMGMSESHLQGWRLPLDAGQFVYVPSEFVKRYENGGLFLLDEVDRADPNVLAVLNQALANGRMPLPARFENPVAYQHPDFIILCAGNTAGTGADRLYTAATRLDEAFLDRFRPGTMFMDYDKTLEKKLVGNTKLLRAMWYIRKRCTDLRIERVVSTRAIVKLHKLFDGTTEVEQALGRLMGTWDASETSKIQISEALAAA